MANFRAENFHTQSISPLSQDNSSFDYDSWFPQPHDEKTIGPRWRSRSIPPASYPATIDSLNKGLDFFYQKTYNEAEKLLRHVASVFEVKLGKDHKDTLDCQYWLALSFYNQAKYVEAEELLEQVVHGRERAVGWNRQEVVRSMYWLSLTLFFQDHYKDAATLLQEVVHERERTNEWEDKDTLDSMYWLGLALYEQSNYKEAEELLARVVFGRDKIAARVSRDSLDSKYWLALALYEQAKYSQAEQLLYQVANGYERQLGEDHKDTLDSKYWLGLVLYDQAKYGGAQELLQPVARGREKTIGKDHVDTLDCKYWLGLAVYFQKKFNEAQGLLQQVSDGCQRTLGRNHENTLDSKYWLGLAIHFQKKFKEAEELFQQVLDIQKVTLGFDGNATLNTSYWLGLALYEQTRYDSAEVVLNEVVQVRKRTIGKRHRDTLDSMYWLGLTFYNRGKYQKAEYMLLRVVKWRRRIMGRDHKDTVNSKYWLGRVLNKQARYIEADELFQEVIFGPKATLKNKYQDATPFGEKIQALELTKIPSKATKTAKQPLDSKLEKVKQLRSARSNRKHTGYYDNNRSRNKTTLYNIVEENEKELSFGLEVEGSEPAILDNKKCNDNGTEGDNSQNDSVGVSKASFTNTGHIEDMQCFCGDDSCSKPCSPYIQQDQNILLDDWKRVQQNLPDSWKWDMEYYLGCWTCTPLESNSPKNFPLKIANAPVVLPVEYQWPPTSGVTPPPDPRPSSPIDCHSELPLEVVRDLFLTFENSIGFYLLISGLLQIIVPDDFDTIWASSHLPHKYGGLKVCYIRQNLEPTMIPSKVLNEDAISSPSTPSFNMSSIFRPTRALSAPLAPKLRLNDFIEARPKSNHRKEKYAGRIGLKVEKDNELYLLVSTHILTEAILAKSYRETILGRNFVRSDKLKRDWNEHIDIWAGNEKIGVIDKTFDEEAEVYPKGFHHDLTLIRPTTHEAVQQIVSPIADIGWLNRESWSSLRRQTSTVKILGSTEGHRSTKSIKCSRPSDILVVGQGIFLNQTMAVGGSKSLKDHDISTWKDLVARALLYRVYPDFDPPNGYSGIALYADGSREDGIEGPGIIGFQSFVQRSGNVQIFEMEGPPLEQRLQLGRIAFYGAFEIPAALKQYHIL